MKKLAIVLAMVLTASVFAFAFPASATRFMPPAPAKVTTKTFMANRTCMTCPFTPSRVEGRATVKHGRIILMRLQHKDFTTGKWVNVKSKRFARSQKVYKLTLTPAAIGNWRTVVVAKHRYYDPMTRTHFTVKKRTVSKASYLPGYR